MELIFRMGLFCFRMDLFCLSLSFYFQNIMDVRGKLLRHVLAFQVESAVCALYGLAYGAITILPVDGVDSLHQFFLLASVDGVEEVLLARMVG